MAKPLPKLTDTTILITGANSGIGRAAATGLAALGAKLVLVCRDPGRGEAARQAIVAASGNEAVDLQIADLAVQADVRRLAATIRSSYARLDVLINNAGVINGSRTLTPDGLESTFALNHLAYFLLTHELMDLLKASAPARIINVSSMGHKLGTIAFDDLQAERGYESLRAYNQSKLANLLFTYELDRRLVGSGITVNAVHPGGVATNFASGNATAFGWVVKLVRPFLRSPEKGAETVVYLAAAPEVAGTSGKYFVDCRPRPSSRESQDLAVAQRLWAVSEQLTGLT
jgi:NAD(P)-dependent dehydrogenase (short-subunit alcohol dehydrogenase family)